MGKFDPEPLNDWKDQLSAALDASYPRWHIEWAEHKDLQDFAKGELSVMAGHCALKRRVADRLFHPLLNAAISAGLVKEV